MMHVYFIATFIYCCFTNPLSCVSRFVSLSLLCCVQQSATLDPPLWEALALPLWEGFSFSSLPACPLPRGECGASSGLPSSTPLQT